MIKTLTLSSATKILPLLLYAAWFSSYAHAFTLPEAWGSAKQHSSDYQIAQFEHNVMNERQRQAKSAFLPHVSAHASYQRQPLSLSSNRETQGWSVQLNQTVFDAGKMAQYRQSRYNTESAEQRLHGTTEELLLRVSEVYFRLLLSKENIAAYAAEKQAYSQQIRQAQEMFQHGAATALDIHEAQAGYDRALAQEIAAIAEKQVLENQLNDYTGLNSTNISGMDTDNIIERYLPKLQQHSLEAWQDIALQHNHEYQMQSLAAKSAEEAMNAAKHSRLPTISLQLGYQDNRYTSAYQNSGHHRGKGLTTSIQLSMPLYTGGELSGKIRETQAQYEIAHTQLIATKRKIKLAIRQAYTEGNSARYQILAQERVLKSSQLKLQSTETGQKYGMRNRLEVIQARQETAQAEQKLAEVKYAFLMAYLRLIKESGLGLENINFNQ